MAIKHIKFDYFQVWCTQEDGDEEDKIFDLTPLLESISDVDLTETSYDYYGEKARIQKIQHHEDTDFWEMQLVRIRKHIVPGIATDGGYFENLDLEEDEGIAEEVSILYDSNKCIIMIRRNRYSLSPSGIGKYFSNMLDKYNIYFKPILIRNVIEKVKKATSHTKINISLANIDYKDTDGASLISVIKTAEKFNAVNAQLTLSIGSNRKRTLDKQKLISVVESLLKRADITKLQISEKENDDTSVEMVDLIEEHIYDRIKISFTREDPITHKRLYLYMIDSYKSKKEEIEKLII